VVLRSVDGARPEHATCTASKCFDSCVVISITATCRSSSSRRAAMCEPRHRDRSRRDDLHDQAVRAAGAGVDCANADRNAWGAVIRVCAHERVLRGFFSTFYFAECEEHLSAARVAPRTRVGAGPVPQRQLSTISSATSIR
jgi:hypothetical protein